MVDERERVAREASDARARQMNAGFREATITTSVIEAAWGYAEDYLPEDDPLRAARIRAQDVGATPISPGGGAALRFLAAVLDARAVVEVGTGAGVSGIWLLRGMREGGVLTSVDIEPEHQSFARIAFTEAGFAPNRARLITGRALEVLPRLADEGYDLVFCDAAKSEYTAYLGEAVRLLRPGGVVAFDNALWRGKVADPAQRDTDTAEIRELGREVRRNDQLVPTMLPVGDGLLVAVRRP